MELLLSSSLGHPKAFEHHDNWINEYFVVPFNFMRFWRALFTKKQSKNDWVSQRGTQDKLSPRPRPMAPWGPFSLTLARVASNKAGGNPSPGRWRANSRPSWPLASFRVELIYTSIFILLRPMKCWALVFIWNCDYNRSNHWNLILRVSQ